MLKGKLVKKLSLIILKLKKLVFLYIHIINLKQQALHSKVATNSSIKYWIVSLPFRNDLTILLAKEHSNRVIDMKNIETITGFKP